jgi:hypothetical protein
MVARPGVSSGERNDAYTVPTKKATIACQPFALNQRLHTLFANGSRCNRWVRRAWFEITLRLVSASPPFSNTCRKDAQIPSRKRVCNTFHPLQCCSYLSENPRMNVEKSIEIACISARLQQGLIPCIRILVLFDLHSDIALISRFLLSCTRTTHYNRTFEKKSKHPHSQPVEQLSF